MAKGWFCREEEERDGDYENKCEESFYDDDDVDYGGLRMRKYEADGERGAKKEINIVNFLFLFLILILEIELC